MARVGGRAPSLSVFRVRNSAQVAQALGGIPQKLLDRHIRRIVGTAARPVLQGAKDALTGDDTGALRRALGVVVKVSKARRSVVAYVGPRKGPEWNMVDAATGRRIRVPVRYAHLVEFGTQPHIVIRRGVRRDGSFYDYAIEHPGTPARPFMRPAFEAGKASVSAALARGIGAAVEEIAKKYGAGGVHP